jgi:hypothetical protein
MWRGVALMRFLGRRHRRRELIPLVRLSSSDGKTALPTAVLLAQMRTGLARSQASCQRCSPRCPENIPELASWPTQCSACCRRGDGECYPACVEQAGTSRGVRGVRAPRAHIGIASPTKCLSARRLGSTERTRPSWVQLASVYVHHQPCMTHSSPSACLPLEVRCVRSSHG